MPDIEKEELLDETLEIAATEKPSPTASLIREGNDISTQIVEETDPDKVEDLTNLFKLNQRKKNIVRANKLSGLLDIIDSEVIERFTAFPEAFDNDQLIAYMEKTARAIGNIEQSIEQKPLIQINNQKNEININESGLNRESREKVLTAVQQLLKEIETNPDDVIDVEVEEGEQ